MISLATVKAFIGEQTTDNDAHLSTEILLLTRVFDNYCFRKFTKSDHTQTFELAKAKKLVFVDQFPVNTVDSVQVDGEDVPYTYNIESGEIIADDCFQAGTLKIEYNAGYDELNIDELLKNIFLSILKIRYERFKAGTLESGQEDIKRLSITGVMTVEYNDKRDSNFNDYLEGYQDALAFFRSERALTIC